MFVLDLESSILIDKPVEEVLSYMGDIENEHEWQSYLREWEILPNPDQNGVGTIRRYTNRYMGRTLTNAYQVNEYEPNGKVTYQSTPDATVHATGGQIWDPINGRTKVNFIFNLDWGISGGIFSSLSSGGFTCAHWKTT